MFDIMETLGPRIWEVVGPHAEPWLILIIHDSSRICLLWWVSAIFIFSMKLMSPKFDEITSYGKLRPDRLLSVGLLSRKTCFLLFYFVGIITATGYVAAVEAFNKATVVVFPTVICLFLGHLTIRILECTVVHKWSSEKVPLLSIVAGLAFYVFAALTVCSSSIFLVEEVGENGPAFYERHTPIDIHVCAVFLFIRFLQFKHHQFLAHLRPSDDTAKEDRKYRLPTRWLFKYFSCPHYLCEMILYNIMAFYMASPPAKLMSGFVVLNLLVTSDKTATWYQKTFNVKRYALIPGVF